MCVCVCVCGGCCCGLVFVHNSSFLISFSFLFFGSALSLGNLFIKRVSLLFFSPSSSDSQDLLTTSMTSHVPSSSSSLLLTSVVPALGFNHDVLGLDAPWSSSRSSSSPSSRPSTPSSFMVLFRIVLSFFSLLFLSLQMPWISRDVDRRLVCKITRQSRRQPWFLLDAVYLSRCCCRPISHDQPEQTTIWVLFRLSLFVINISL